MSYSLSQLDAIGDVDPVAEADVYLAYGRDLQAEEILKEAMRGNPERMAIRTKLLEVYAKRRDTKGFELLATQLYSLTQRRGRGLGEGAGTRPQIDPENPLYQPGGAPGGGAGGQPGRWSSRWAPARCRSRCCRRPRSSTPRSIDVRRRTAGVDLDLDLDAAMRRADRAGAAAEHAAARRRRRPVEAPSFDLDAARPDAAGLRCAAAGAAPHRPSAPSVEFDLAGISLDLDLPAAGSPARGADSGPTTAPSGFGESGLSGFDDDDAADPLARKLELAEEFRQIGDIEGARDLLQEVVAKAVGLAEVQGAGHARATRLMRGRCGARGRRREPAVRLALGVSYRGTGYQGWQSQPGGHTVQDRLEQALASFARRAGAHDLRRPHRRRRARAQPGRAPRRDGRARAVLLGARHQPLPAATTSRCSGAGRSTTDFHARNSALGRRYVYVLLRVAGARRRSRPAWSAGSSARSTATPCARPRSACSASTTSARSARPSARRRRR